MTRATVPLSDMCDMISYRFSYKEIRDSLQYNTTNQISRCNHEDIHEENGKCMRKRHYSKINSPDVEVQGLVLKKDRNGPKQIELPK